MTYCVSVKEMLTRILLRTGQIAASLASLSRTVDDYSALSKKELIPEKQEKAFERVKNFRGELGEYRQEFDHMRKTREDAVCSGPPSPSLRARSELTNGVTLKKAIHVKPQRALWPSSPPRRHPREPIHPIRPPPNILTLRQPFLVTIRSELRCIAGRLQPRNARAARTVLPGQHQQPTGRVS